MADQIRKTFWKDWREVSSRKGYQGYVECGVCSDHKSKEAWECCREAVREAAKKHSEKNKEI